MKTYRNLFKRMTTPEMVKQAALDAAEGKIHRPEVMGFFMNFDASYDFVIHCANDPNYRPCEDNQHEIIDGNNNKKREIEKPQFCPEQVLHHMLVEPFKEVLLNGLYEQVYGCLPAKVLKVDPTTKKVISKNFGPHAAIKQLTKWVQVKKKIFVGVTDIHHAYGSVHISTLARMMAKVIKDSEWLRLTYAFLHYYPNETDSDEMYGLILGHYTSPWFFNFYLKKFDHYMAAIPEIKYMRFADNIFIVGTNKRKVHKAMKAMRDYLYDNLRLELNRCTQVFRFEYIDKSGKIRGRAIDCLGAIIHCNRLGLRKSILKRMRRKAKKIKKKDHAVSWHDGASMLSRISWVRSTDTFQYYVKNIRSNIKIKRLKKRVRNHIKKIQPISEERRKKINEGLEKSKRLTGNKA